MPTKVRLFTFPRSRSRRDSCSFLTAHCLLLLFRRKRQSKHRNHALPCHIDLRLSRIRKVQGLAVFAAIDLRVAAPGLFRISASLLQNVFAIEPALQVSAAKFTLLVFFVAGALTLFLDLHFVIWKLRNVLSAGSGHFASSQGRTPFLCAGMPYPSRFPKYRIPRSL